MFSRLKKASEAVGHIGNAWTFLGFFGWQTKITAAGIAVIAWFATFFGSAVEGLSVTAVWLASLAAALLASLLVLVIAIIIRVLRGSRPKTALPTTSPTSAGINLASIGLTPPDNVTVTDEVVSESLAIMFLNLANSDGKQTLFRRSWSAFPNGSPSKRHFSYHQYFVAVENKSSTKTLRGVRLVAETLHGLGGLILNREFPCERTGTASADIPPRGKDYYLIGEGIDESDAGIFNVRIVAPNEYDRILLDIENREKNHVGFILSTTNGKTYSILKNDGNKLTISAYADDNPPATGTLIINTKSRIQVWLVGEADTK